MRGGVIRPRIAVGTRPAGSSSPTASRTSGAGSRRRTRRLLAQPHCSRFDRRLSSVCRLRLSGAGRAVHHASSCTRPETRCGSAGAVIRSRTRGAVRAKGTAGCPRAVVPSCTSGSRVFGSPTSGGQALILLRLARSAIMFLDCPERSTGFDPFWPPNRGPGRRAARRSGPIAGRSGWEGLARAGRRERLLCFAFSAQARPHSESLSLPQRA